LIDHAGLGTHERVERRGVEAQGRQVERDDRDEPPADVVDHVHEAVPAEAPQHPPQRDAADHEHHEVEDLAREVPLRLGRLVRFRLDRRLRQLAHLALGIMRGMVARYRCGVGSGW